MANSPEHRLDEASKEALKAAAAEAEIVVEAEAEAVVEAAEAAVDAAEAESDAVLEPLSASALSGALEAASHAVTVTAEDADDPFEDSLEELLEEDDAPRPAPANAAEGASTALVAAEAAAAVTAPTGPKHAKPAKKRSGKALKIVFASLVVILLAMVGLGYGYYHGKISLLDFDDGTTTLDGTIDEQDAAVIAQAAEMESAVADLAITDPILDEKTERTLERVFDSNVINILLLGTDERSNTFTDAARSDTIILCSVNTDTGAIKLISLERGMGVPVLEGRYQGEWDWITHIFRYGGADLMMKTVTYCFDVDVPYYVRVNFNTFITLIDTMGGVDITLSQREADGLNTNIVAYNLDLCDWVHAGENHMNGFLALQYARMRKIDSDWSRVVRQRNTIRQVLVKAKSLSASELDNVLDTVLPLIRTNMTEKEITALLLKLPLFMEKMDIDEVTIPVKGTYGSMTGMGGRSLFAADFPANAKIIQDMIYGTDEG